MAVLMLYDGLCGLCNGTVQWILKHDKFDRFRFAAQQSELAAEILQRHGINREAMLGSNSVYLIENINSPDEKVLVRSDVTLRALRVLGGFWSVLGHCFQLVPRFVRDAGYTAIARNRFRIAGRYETCPIPTSAERAKFLGI